MLQEEVFAQLGFNALESEVYIALSKHGPQTAYKIGKLLGRPTANVYKAVDVLAEHGAIELMEGDVRICKALPIQSVVKQMERGYQNKMKQAVDALGNLSAESKDEGIYKLQTVEAVFQRAKEMIKRTKSVLVIDAFPNALQRIKKDIQQVKGKEVFVQAYEEPGLDNHISLVVPEISAKVLAYWDAEQLNIAVDGKEMLVALFSKKLDKLVQATYSNNLYLSCMVYSGILNEHKVHRFSKAKTMQEVEKIRSKQKFFLNSKVPGLDMLFEMYKKAE
jgi:sugar-specific transcriptional regulator TrmB